MKDKFRISALNLFLTYSRVDKSNENLNHQGVLNELQAKNKISIKNYLIVKENHKEGGFHFHVLLTLFKKCCIRNPLYLDILGIHGKYESVRSLRKSIEYTLKEDKDFLTNYSCISKEGDYIEEKSPELELLSKLKDEDLNYLLKEYIDNFPERALKKITSLKKNLETILDVQSSFLNKDLIDEFPYTLKDIDWSNLIDAKVLNDWIALPNEEKPALVLTGKTGMGKTFWTLCFCKTMNLPALYMTDFEGFNNLKKEHKIWVLDDANLANIPKLNMSAITKLLDNRTSTDLRLLNKSKTRQQGMVGIVLANDLSTIIKSPEQRVLRRTTIVNFDKPIVYLNVNITNNITNNNYILEKNQAIWLEQASKTKEDLLDVIKTPKKK